MKVSVVDENGSGIMAEFAKAIGASVRGRFFYIPKDKGGGYLTGFNWGSDLRMMVRNYYLKEEILLERTNLLAEGQDNVIFFLSGVFAPMPAEKEIPLEQASVFIGMQAVSSVISMPSNTYFSSVTIAASRHYLREYFGGIDHPVVASILEAKNNFVFETGITAEMIQTAGEMVRQTIPESLEIHYYKLKCEELLCYIFAQLLQREAVATSGMHIEDMKAIYTIKLRLQSALNQAPDIASLARAASMSEPKLRKLFKQTFGKGVFEYYQSSRMQEAARLLKEKRLTVSEVGYQLGFTNLSHFSRVFEQHIGMKPKKYSSA
ncbi:helix-turn-helix domain-containing protein [Pedobacter polysacchareus]|uniref:helix-turn-helix domain-containing protein n=1 Tax=Pedobacter polysacchareus TaxID=2861973 RepID=UPI001C993FD5|nr:helix-turn-helix domain-containing protein [Pedobacter polysacchareus]